MQEGDNLPAGAYPVGLEVVVSVALGYPLFCRPEYRLVEDAARAYVNEGVIEIARRRLSVVPPQEGNKFRALYLSMGPECTVVITGGYPVLRSPEYGGVVRLAGAAV